MKNGMEGFAYCKLEIFIPASHLPVLREALRQADAGHIGCYDSCLSCSPVTSSWRPLPGSHPYDGAENVLRTAPEVKVEVVCPAASAERTVAAVRAVHPYEVPVINVIPLWMIGAEM